MTDNSNSAIIKRFFARMIRRASGPSSFGHKIESNDPNERLEELELMSALATAVIFAGIVLEMVAIWRVPEGTPKDIVDTFANALIGIGLVVEYFCILGAIVATRAANRESKEEVALANKLASEAMADAMKARQKTAEIYAKFSARHLTPDQKLELGKFVNGAGLSVRLSYGGTPESGGLYSDFANALRSADASLRIEDAGDDPAWRNGILVSAADLEKAKSVQSLLASFGFERVFVVDHRQMPLNPALAKRDPKKYWQKVEEPPPTGEVWVHIAAMPVPEPPDPELPPEAEEAMRREEEMRRLNPSTRG
jgi:hypothetical protein